MRQRVKSPLELLRRIKWMESLPSEQRWGQIPDLVICVREEARTDLVGSEVKDKDDYKAR